MSELGVGQPVKDHETRTLERRIGRHGESRPRREGEVDADFSKDRRRFAGVVDAGPSVRIRERAPLLAGPRFNLMTRSVRPYVKGLAGVGHFNFPFGYANGNYFVAAPGGGVEWHHKRFAVKVVDVEYQMWPQFSYGAIHPYGISTGITFRLWHGKSMMSEE